MNDFIGTVFMLGTGVIIGAVGMRIIWLMHMEEIEVSRRRETEDDKRIREQDRQNSDNEERVSGDTELQA